MTRSGHLSLILVAVIGLLAFSSPSAHAAFELKGQTECIAPSNPGGGWDAICRTTSAVLQKTGMIKSPMYVTNMPGGSGAVAIANVTNVTGIFRASPPMRRTSCSPDIAWITLPAPRNRQALKNACV